MLGQQIRQMLSLKESLGFALKPEIVRSPVAQAKLLLAKWLSLLPSHRQKDKSMANHSTANLLHSGAQSKTVLAKTRQTLLSLKWFEKSLRIIRSPSLNGISRAELILARYQPQRS